MNKKGNPFPDSLYDFPGKLREANLYERVFTGYASQLAQSFFCLNFWAAFMLCW